MYSPYLQKYIRQISAQAHVDPASVAFLEQSLLCFATTFGRVISAETEPSGNLLEMSLQLLLLDDGLDKIARPNLLEGSHYLVGLGLEQTGELLARLDEAQLSAVRNPFENDHWYRLVLAFLHYLAGGHRVQALGVLRHLSQVTTQAQRATYQAEYRQAQRALELLYAGDTDPAISDRQARLLLGQGEPRDPQEQRLFRLIRRVQDRSDVVLSDLGRRNEAEWLSRRGIRPSEAAFWARYLELLERRGITTFTSEQVGPGGFDTWLQPGTDLLVILPTGAGKTIIGELRSALTLAQGQQVVWMIPTRALVRQTKRELRRAFEPLGVAVEELPTTEDFIPLFADGIAQPGSVAATTPEKLAALIRANPDAVANIGLVVLDEAQILEEARGTTAEFVLQQIRHKAPQVDVVLMSASLETEDVLEGFLTALGRKPKRLVSDVSLTRRIYGVVTDSRSNGRPYPKVLLYPPGIQGESERTENPVCMNLKAVSLRSNEGPLHTAQRFVRSVASSGIRSVLFVGRKDSTEKQAQEIAKGSPERIDLPDTDRSRLRVELGRPSVVEETCQKSVASHHAGLTPLEQHLVEKWLRDGIIGTVVATPTLAQGVNLPFDLSIVSFKSRYNKLRRASEPLSRTELLNMLGRAGRAGYVSDGVCLMAAQTRDSDPVKVLDEHRSVFFGPRTPTEEGLGLSRLVSVALSASVDSSDWLIELGGATLSEVQTLVAFVLTATTGQHDVRQALIDQMLRFPSVQQMPTDEIAEAAESLEGLANNIQDECDADPDLAAALERTGMPVEVLKHFLSELRSGPDLLDIGAIPRLVWTDDLVRGALENCSSREWYSHLVQGAELGPMFLGISLWREGAPVVDLETNWQLSKSKRAREKSNRIAIGDFLNHRLSLFAQFWGALAVCGEQLQGGGARGSARLTLQLLPAFVREGVSSLEGLEWLYAIGSIDRVLAHSLARTTAPMDSTGALRRYIGERLQQWRSNPGTIPSDLGAHYRSATAGVLDEIAPESRG